MWSEVETILGLQREDSGRPSCLSSHSCKQCPYLSPEANHRQSKLICILHLWKAPAVPIWCLSSIGGIASNDVLFAPHFLTLSDCLPTHNNAVLAVKRFPGLFPSNSTYAEWQYHICRVAFHPCPCSPLKAATHWWNISVLNPLSQILYVSVGDTGLLLSSSKMAPTASASQHVS